MGFLRNIRNGLARFMYGRNGADQLHWDLFKLYLLLCVLGGVSSAALQNRVLTFLIRTALWILAAVILYRMFSRNLAKRREENRRWLNFRGKAAALKARRADKDHRYFTCKSCRTVCRVPAGKGRIVITCPKCGAQIQAKT